MPYTSVQKLSKTKYMHSLEVERIHICQNLRKCFDEIKINSQVFFKSNMLIVNKYVTLIFRNQRKIKI